MNKTEEDLQFILKEFPFVVQRITNSSPAFDISLWIMQNVGNDMIVIDKALLDIFRDSIRVTYAFKHEADAIAFKIKFP